MSRVCFFWGIAAVLSTNSKVKHFAGIPLVFIVVIVTAIRDCRFWNVRDSRMIPYLGPEFVNALFERAACEEAPGVLPNPDDAKLPVAHEKTKAQSEGKTSQKVAATSTNVKSSTISCYGALPLRAIVGIGFFLHGYSKLSKGPEAFSSILYSLHVPLPQLSAYFTIGVELLGGVALLLGAFVNWVSIPATVVLLSAMFTVHLPYGFSSIKLKAVVDGRAQFGPPGYECDLLYVACIFALVLLGPGPWSFDRYRLRERGVGTVTGLPMKGELIQ
jgi:putative oxidoreductase